MNFELLEKFEWYNEPENVRFEDNSMCVYAKPETDFWQCVQRGFKKDNGHFFFLRQGENFVFTLKWGINELKNFSQCGLMLRGDERNWFKVYLMGDLEGKQVLGCSLTVNGHSDWTGFDINREVKEVFFRISRDRDDYIVFYSFDGLNYTKFKTFFLQCFDEEIKVGAFVANPNNQTFFAELSDIDIQR